MPVIDEILNFLTNDLNITISNKKRDQVINRFYPDIKDKIYWYVDGSGFYEGIISKEEYDKIKTLPPDTQINFPEIAKYVNDECELNDISFKKDVNQIKKLLDKGFKKSTTYFDLMSYLYENEKLK